jgi:hypothetical protein
MPEHVLILVSITGLIILIFLLSAALSEIDRGSSKEAKETQGKQASSSDQNHGTHPQRIADAVADAIDTYRLYRQSDDRHREKRSPYQFQESLRYFLSPLK